MGCYIVRLPKAVAERVDAKAKSILLSFKALDPKSQAFVPQIDPQTSKM